MNFYKKVILKHVPEFQKLTEEQQRISVMMHKHKYIAMWISALFATTSYPGILTLVLSAATLVILNFVNATVGNILFWTTFPYNLFVCAMYFYWFRRVIIKKDTNQEYYNRLFDFFTKPWLYNYKVVTKKDWKKLKVANKTRYKAYRTEESNHHCYSVTYELARIIASKDVKIVWIFMESWCSKCGHAILIKGDYVYDSNMRRTYKKNEYFRYFKVQVFNEFDYTEWSTYDALKQSEAWQAFAIWCRQLGGKRDSDGEQG